METDGGGTGIQGAEQCASSWAEEVAGSDKLVEEVITRRSELAGS